MNKKIYCSLLLALGMSMLPPIAVNATPITEINSINGNIDGNYGATNSQKNTSNTLPLSITTPTDIIEDKVNLILTERINICKVNNQVSDTVDSISLAADALIAEKAEREEAITKEKEIEERKIKKAEEERQKAIEKAKQDELYLLATIIHCEARGESFTGQVAVGAVVLNRVKSNEFPNTIKDVIYQKGQFTPVSKGTFDNVLLKGNINNSCIEAAKAALNGENPIRNCLYFRTLNGTSGYIIGNHVFY